MVARRGTELLMPRRATSLVRRGCPGRRVRRHTRSRTVSILGRDLRLWLLLLRGMTRWALWCLAVIDVRRTCARDTLVDTSQPVL